MGHAGTILSLDCWQFFQLHALLFVITFGCLHCLALKLLETNRALSNEFLNNHIATPAGSLAVSGCRSLPAAVLQLQCQAKYNKQNACRIQSGQH